MSLLKNDLLRNIPSVETLLQDPQLQAGAHGLPRRLVVDCVRAAVDETRAALIDQPPAEAGAAEIGPEDIRRAVWERIEQGLLTVAGPHYRKVINATGIILHTALGRAVLPRRAVAQIAAELSGYSLLQAEIESGQRSKRDQRIEELLRQLTGAEAATVVNNNAAATMIVLATVAKGREVIVSRGQLVEIGGSFRIPEVMAASGATLVEVGTTNRTHPRDYQRAITASTAAILRVHPSNYKISGFTAEVALEELAAIARANHLTLIDDVGAGSLVDVSRFGFDKEPTLPDSVRAGADLITSSTDKLIGGAQGGIILGRADLVEAVRKNPLARVLRVGKLTLAALEATLSLFLDEATALVEVPTLRMLRRQAAEIAVQAERIAAAVTLRAPAASVAVIDGSSQVGSGSLPTQNLPTRLVAIGHPAISPQDLALELRRGRPPVFARVHKDQLLLDPRTLLDGEETVLVEAVAAVLGPKG